MNCCDYDCHQGKDCPARSATTQPDETPMSHAKFPTNGHAVIVTGKPSRTRRVLRFLRNPWTIALGLTAATWAASVLIVSKAIGA